MHYVNKKKITEEIKNDLKIYAKNIYDHTIQFSWNVKNSTSSSNHSFFDVNDEKRPWYANTVFVIFRNKIILKKRKSTYSHEINESYLNNYYFGFGFAEKGDDLNIEEENFYNLINNNFCIFICLDYQQRIDYYRNLILKEEEYYIPFKKDIRQEINELKKLFIKYYSKTDESKKKIFILISNSTNINANLNDIEEDSLIIYCDSMNSSVFSLKRDDNIQDIIWEHKKSLEIDDIKYKYNDFQINYNYIFMKIENAFERELMEKNFFRIAKNYIPEEILNYDINYKMIGKNGDKNNTIKIYLKIFKILK